MKSAFITIVSLSLLISSCNLNNEQKQTDSHIDKKSGKSHTDHNKSNVHMNKAPFEDLVKAFEDEERADWQKPDLVIKKLGDINGKTIGDIGSGTGYFSFRLAEQNANVVAIDVDERFIAFIEQRIAKDSVSTLTTRLVGYDNPNLSDNEFDALIIIDTYHHFNDKVEYMNYCKRGLKDDGTLLIVDFKNRKTSHGPPVDHRISVEMVELDLQKSGFSQIEIDTTSLSEQYIITVKK
jgi:cyclopropane fatty-acyl-phospholipid synthase-like methyltransferase